MPDNDSPSQTGTFRVSDLVAVAAAATVLAVWSSRVGDRRGGVQDAPWLCLPFPASCPFRGFHHSVSGPRHIEPDRRISRIRLTAKASSIGVMRPFSWGMLSRGSTPDRKSVV